MGELSPWHLLILAAVFVVLFGSRKLPDAARAIGRSMRIFKAETKALHGDDESADTVRSGPAVQQPPLQQPVAQQPAVGQPSVQQTVQRPAQVSVTLDDGSIVSGVPLAEAQRNQQPT